MIPGVCLPPLQNERLYGIICKCLFICEYIRKLKKSSTANKEFLMNAEERVNVAICIIMCSCTYLGL